MDIAEVKRNIRGWLSGRPRLLTAVFKLLGKPHAEISIFRSLVRKGDTVFDIGANTGQYLCLFSTLVGRDGSVHGFEPIPPTFETLRKNAELHAKSSEVFLNNVAVGEKEGVVKMSVPDGRFTEASMAPLGEGGQNIDFDNCRVITLDDYVKRGGVEKVSLIKCDVEGAELLAMKGAIGLIKRDHPILFLEAWSGWTERFGYKPEDLFEFLEREGGYVIYHVYRGGMRKVTAGKGLPPDSFPDFLNFLCVVPAIHGDRLRFLENYVS